MCVYVNACMRACVYVCVQDGDDELILLSGPCSHRPSTKYWLVGPTCGILVSPVGVHSCLATKGMIGLDCPQWQGVKQVYTASLNN